MGFPSQVHIIVIVSHVGPIPLALLGLGEKGSGPTWPRVLGSEPIVYGEKRIRVERNTADLEWGCSQLSRGSLGVNLGLGPRRPLGAPAVRVGGGERNTTLPSTRPERGCNSSSGAENSSGTDR